MIIYLAGGPNNAEEFYPDYLLSYYYAKSSLPHFMDCIQRKKDKTCKNLFLDSGAFSALSQGSYIDLDEYIKFIKANEKGLTVYANLDDITCPIKTWENQLYMESYGLDPLPCYHYGEDVKHLINYIDQYDYIAIGGTVPISSPKLALWFDEIFDKYLCDEKGKPRLRIHGFGMTNFDLMKMYPWHSTDSTAWRLAAGMGGFYVPYPKKGAYDYTRTPYLVSSGERHPKNHFDTMTPTLKKYAAQYVKEIGFTMEQATEYRYRAQINMHFITEFNKKLNNKTFKRKRPSTFGLG